jgi:putative transposase
LARKRKFDFWSYVEGCMRGSMEIQRILYDESLPQCKYCGGRNVVRYGHFRGIQRWWCKDCKRKFAGTDAAAGMKTPAVQIASALSMYYSGMSLNAIRRHLDQQYNNHPSESTLYDWLTRFTTVAVKEAYNYQPEVGDVWVADETVLTIGGDKFWFWDIIDVKTRFLLASHLSRSRNAQNAQKLMELASERAGKIPRVVITDKMGAYLDGIELAFGAETKHIAAKQLTAKPGTQLIERFHGSLKDRTKVMRGLKKASTASLLMEGWLVHYNFFRPHETLGDRTPAQKAGIKFPFKNWADVSRIPLSKQGKILAHTHTKIPKFLKNEPPPHIQRLIGMRQDYPPKLFRRRRHWR